MDKRDIASYIFGGIILVGGFFMFLDISNASLAKWGQSAYTCRNVCAEDWALNISGCQREQCVCFHYGEYNYTVWDNETHVIWDGCVT